ncbi:uncharacterized protein BO95DRAFT_465891 [Aspergillus brunneoviolaceus CBS 621.78]|uniref:Uncharacterized protein n=1 Tax=Aspergillus brunneoviolaceus CBS 621.78 TaxID=1450534 RepID=A0ACD1G2Q0_9EURO|nr:hypothetical protein BO95DRAFT_465891 [Aspergillus brunneoviolaceus CBS 621.78]RAH43502.1 hypothetical protein BO95DRAFT_465891 [Aspergillus brunneoviolaceus CBS 621.78]
MASVRKQHHRTDCARVGKWFTFSFFTTIVLGIQPASPFHASNTLLTLFPSAYTPFASVTAPVQPPSPVTCTEFSPLHRANCEQCNTPPSHLHHPHAQRIQTPLHPLFLRPKHLPRVNPTRQHHPPQERRPRHRLVQLTHIQHMQPGRLSFSLADRAPKPRWLLCLYL